MKEININIEGYNVNGICVGCLNYNRRMYYHPDVKKCFRLLGNIDVPDGLEVQVCWECLGHVTSSIRFKERMLKSYDFLIRYSKEHTFLDSPNDFSYHASTSIQQTDVQIYEYVPETGEDGEKDVNVKEEEVETKYTFDVAIKEETFDDPYFEEIPAIDNDVISSDEDVQLSKLKEKETEKGKKKRKNERKKDRMPAIKKPRKTSRGMAEVSQFEAAYAEIIQGTSLRQAAKKYGLCYMTLHKYKNKRETTNFPVKMGYASNTIFTSEQEIILMQYLEIYAEIFPCLSAKVVRQYASELSEKLGIKRPKSWVCNGLAGADWYKNFVFKNKSVEDKIVRSTGKEKVRMFYNRLWRIYGQYNFCSENIYCLDEIGVNIEEFRDKIWLISTKNGPVALNVSQVRFSYAANAAGYATPPLFLMPRNKEEAIHIKTEFPNDTTYENFLNTGVDLKTIPDWTEDPDFMVFLKHFMKYLRNTVGPKLFLLLENQTFHLSIECIEFCKQNDILLLVIPTYLGQNLQPLYPILNNLKPSIYAIYDNLVLEQPERKKSIYTIPNIISEGLFQCLNKTCIQDGFKNTGIFPYNREIIINRLEETIVEENA